MRYDNEYIDGLLSLSVHIFKEVYNISRSVIKFHVEEWLHKIFGLIRL